MELNNQTRAQLAFFGVTLENASQVKFNLFEQINQIILYGEGRYDFATLYNIPIWLRYKIFDDLQNFINKKTPKSSNQTDILNPDGSVNKSAYESLNNIQPGKTSYK